MTPRPIILAFCLLCVSATLPPMPGKVLQSPKAAGDASNANKPMAMPGSPSPQWLNFPMAFDAGSFIVQESFTVNGPWNTVLAFTNATNGGLLVSNAYPCEFIRVLKQT